MQYWLIKSEPGAYSIADLKRDGHTHWNGVRNYQARNFMRTMQVGDRILFYHSNAEPMAVVGTATVAKAAYPDFTAWDPKDHHFDPKSTPEKPLWDMVDVAYEATLPQPVTLEQIKRDDALEGMVLRQKGSRLSVQPVSAAHFERVCTLGGL